MSKTKSTARAGLAGALLALAAAPAARAAVDDDLFLLTTNLPPNVVLLQDNSVSMNHIEWHWAFDPTAVPACSYWDNDKEYVVNGPGGAVPSVPAGLLALTLLQTADVDCHRTRVIRDPAEAPADTLYQGRYLNWLFSPASDLYVVEIATAMHVPPPCNTPACNDCDEKYRRTRGQMAKQVLLDTLCIAEPQGIRFGQAFFRDPNNAPANDDPNGGYVAVPVDDPSPAHAADLEAHIKNIKSFTGTPLAEALFQIYTFFMSRTLANLPKGQDGLTSFPKYSYKTSTGVYTTAASQIPKDPVEGACQKHFVIVVTDGKPDHDTFDADPASTALGFADYAALVGDYHADGELEVPGDTVETSWYLDDLAKYMHEKDFRPDVAADQTLDVYTIGLATDSPTDLFLERVAAVSDGLFFTAQDGDQLSAALVAALNDIIEKSQSFTAATVPSSRTADGGDFYTSFFLPSGKRAFWEGHLRSWHITAAGDIEDANGDCPLVEPTPGECNSGPFDPAAVPFWDAGSQLPLPAARTLYTSKLVAGQPTQVPFAQTLDAAELGIATFTTPGSPPNPAPNSGLYSIAGSTATSEEGLADEVVAYAAGCEFGTGVAANVETPLACDPRSWRLGDIFHSNPVVVRQPTGVLVKDLSYLSFQTNQVARPRRIYAGANDGFLHAFRAGSWDGTKYDEGDGVEDFAFMPWQVRGNVRHLPIDPPTSRHYYVDGSPSAADAWFHPTPTTALKDASEWHTVLLGGLRQGGRQYYALDVTDPTSSSFPGYLWEFPREDDPDDPGVGGSSLPWVGETWGSPIVTRVRVRVGADDNAGAGYERWVAVVTGGYAAVSDPNSLAYDPTALAGRSIFLIDLKTGEVLAEQRFDPAATDETSKMAYAIAATPAVFDSDFDGYADLVYVGDLGGQVWKWVIRPLGDDRVNDGTGLRTQPSWTFRRIFTAPVATISGDDYYKSIFMQAEGALSGGKLWLTFATGERANLPFEGVAGDPDENNRLYVITDPDRFEQLVTPLPTLTESDLVDLSASEASCTPLTGRGYHFVVEDGEKFVTRSTVFASLVVAASFQPVAAGAADPCQAKGTGRLYIFKLTCGQGVFDDGSGSVERGLEIGVGFPTDPQISLGVDGMDNRIYIEKSSTNDDDESGSELFSIEAPDLDLDQGGLIYWRELE